MAQSDQIQSAKKLKPLQQTQNYLQAALQTVIQAQAMENTQATQQTEQNIQKAQQTLSQAYSSAKTTEEKNYVEIAQSQIQQAQMKLQDASQAKSSE
ncbi:coenzyme F420-reducing hydrogenase alpha subunit [Pullulanibacillus pueri]|uniref:Uncharacterized protein n=1 Tax=Pullulanibacillus pueri TaxID=1437324 RepID=A0A8J2ZW63_9BACL|nr:hypothetical protein [Pullulanibacillus pueri]MBM7682310.1 coenzyme F420-reducing hydrogenase alpha subunit [Pullulanibacillus pueri]GGH80846.1 hypothetical protein GCM10007096_17860 [Pullulanibacillus pueri]